MPVVNECPRTWTLCANHWRAHCHRLKHDVAKRFSTRRKHDDAGSRHPRFDVYDWFQELNPVGDFQLACEQVKRLSFRARSDHGYSPVRKLVSNGSKGAQKEVNTFLAMQATDVNESPFALTVNKGHRSKGKRNHIHNNTAMAVKPSSCGRIQCSDYSRSPVQQLDEPAPMSPESIEASRWNFLRTAALRNDCPHTEPTCSKKSKDVGHINEADYRIWANFPQQLAKLDQSCRDRPKSRQSSGRRSSVIEPPSIDAVDKRIEILNARTG